MSAQEAHGEVYSFGPDLEGPAYESAALGNARAMIMLDYQSLDLTSGGKFDLHGVHYLHQMTDWLYGGFGFSAPMFEGNYGGFFSAAITLHAQKKVYGNWFVDGGVSFGAGAGGASVSNILTLSGDGTYLKKYGGVGYDFGSFSIGANYAHIGIDNSPINDSTISFFFQKPLSFAVGSHADNGSTISATDYGMLGNETILSFEFSNLTQINPTGKYKGDIGLVSPQISQFIDDKNYYFVGLDLGFSGLIWYNQAQVGLGRRFELTPDISLYGQIGVGSGGWVTDTINTGPGLIVYPKVKAEYRFSDSLGVFVSAGYLAAPFGTSRNWSLGAGVNFHLPSAREATKSGGAKSDVAVKGVRASLFGRWAFNVEDGNGPFNDLYLATLQVDYKFSDHWYVPIQISAATNDYKGYAGYVEGYTGLGWESDPLFSGKLQAYGQVLYGLNDIGINSAMDPGALLYPSVGLSYNLTDTLSVYGQVGKTISLGQYLDPASTNFFESTSVGLGVSYRFGLPTWSSR